jgi:hypothetical protein
MSDDGTGLARKKLLIGGLTAAVAALAGCASQTDRDDDKEETDDGGNASLTQRPARSGLDAFGSPSFGALTAFIPLKDTVALDLVVMISPLGRQVGTVQPDTGETTAAFTLPGADYPAGLYTVRGYQLDGSGMYDEVAMRQYPFAPEVRISDVIPGQEAGKVKLVLENTGTGPYEASQFRFSEPDLTPSIEQWNSWSAETVYVLPGESTPFGDLSTNFSREGDRDSGDTYCDGTDEIRRVFEVRGGQTNRTRIERQFTIVADGEVSWAESGIFVSNSYTCTEMQAVE